MRTLRTIQQMNLRNIVFRFNRLPYHHHRSLITTGSETVKQNKEMNQKAMETSPAENMLKSHENKQHDKKGILGNLSWKSLKEQGKKYGPFFLVYYTGVWIGTGCLIYSYFEYVGSDFAFGLLKDVGLDKYIDLTKIDPSYGNLAVAIAVNELIEPIRLPIGVLSAGPAYRGYQSIRQAIGLNQPHPIQETKPGFWSNLKSTGKKYGTFFVGYYGSVYLGMGTLIYLSLNHLGPEYSFQLLQHYGVDQYVDLNKFDPAIGNFAVAIAANELLEPVRLPLVVLTIKPLHRKFQTLRSGNATDSSPSETKQ